MSDRPRARVVPCSAADSAKPLLLSMTLNIHAKRLRGVFSIALLLLWSPLSGQTSCPPSADSALARGWRAYRSDSLPVASQEFRRTQALCPGNLDALVGLGFVLLR